MKRSVRDSIAAAHKAFEDSKVVRLWSGQHEKRIRIPGPGEQSFDAAVIILPVVYRSPITNPPRNPRRRRKAP